MEEDRKEHERKVTGRSQGGRQKTWYPWVETRERRQKGIRVGLYDL